MAAHDDLKSGRRWISVIAAGLVGIGLGLALGRLDRDTFTPSYVLTTYMSSASGLRVKSLVDLVGIPAGSVISIRPDLSGPKPLEVSMRIAKKYQPSIRADSVATVQTAGLLGENYVNISLGSPNQPLVPGGGTITSVDLVSPSAADTNACADLTKLISATAAAAKAKAK